MDSVREQLSRYLIEGGVADHHSRKNRIKPITRRDEENKQEEEKKFTKMDKVRQKTNKGMV